MANLKQPAMCCCLLPRAGIMLFTFIYACYGLSGMFFSLLANIIIEKPTPMQYVEGDSMTSKLTNLSFTWENMADTLCAFVYFYAFILAYTRKWKSFQPVLNAFPVIVIYGLYSIYSVSKVYYTLFSASSNTFKFDQLDDDQKADMEELNDLIALYSLPVTLAVYIIPWAIQIYMIKQTRSYIQYVLYKKEEKPVPSSSEQQQVIE